MSYSKLIRGVAKSVNTPTAAKGVVRSVDSINKSVSVALAGSTAIITAAVPNDIDFKYLSPGAAVDVNIQRNPIIVAVLDQPSRAEETSTYQATVAELTQRIEKLELIVQALVRDRDSGGVQQSLIDALPRTTNRGGF